MKRRFVVIINKKGTRVGVIAASVSAAVWGLWFYDKPFPDTSSVVIAFAPEAWFSFMELAEDEDWPELDSNEIMHFGGEDETT